MFAERLSIPVQFRNRFVSWRRFLANLALITTGSAVFAVGLNGVLIPQHFLSGGAVGIALILHYMIPKVNVGVIYFLFNIPLVFLGWFSISRRFMLYTCYGMAVFSLTAATIAPHIPPIDNPILAAILAGIICGAGAGITLRSQGSAGGMDILSVYLNKEWGLRVGTTGFMINALVLTAGAFFFSLELALYSLIYVYTSARIVDAVITGFNQRKAILVVSDQAVAIAQQIMARMNRGATLFDAVGAYSQKRKQVIFSIVTLTEIAKVKELIFDIDPDAFVVINDTLEVLGKRHGTRRVY